MPMIRAHRNTRNRLALSDAALMLFDKGFDDSVHIHIACQMVGFVEIPLRAFAFCGTEMGKMNPIAPTLDHAYQIVIGSNAKSN